MCVLPVHGAVQEVLEGRGHVEVLVDHEGHSEVHVVNQLKAFGAYGPHRVEHGHLVQVVASEHHIPVWPWPWLLVQDGEEGSAARRDRVGTKEGVVRQRKAKPVHDSGNEVGGADHGLAVLAPPPCGVGTGDQEWLGNAWVVEVSAAIGKRYAIVRGVDDESVILKSIVLQEL